LVGSERGRSGGRSGGRQQKNEARFTRKGPVSSNAQAAHWVVVFIGGEASVVGSLSRAQPSRDRERDYL